MHTRHQRRIHHDLGRFAIIALAFALLAPAPTLAEATVGQPVIDALAEKPMVRVMIAFDVAVPSELERGAFLTSDAGREAITMARGQVLRAIPSGEFVLRRQFESVHAVAGEMVTDATNGLSFPRLDCQDALDRTFGSIFADGFESGDTTAW